MADDEEHHLPCTECSGTKFVKKNGKLFCSGCDYEVVGHEETVLDDFGISGQSINRNRSKVIVRKEKKVADNTREIQALNWDIYDGYNVILLKMTHALIRCGELPPDLKWTVKQLWDGFLCRVEKMKKEPEQKDEAIPPPADSTLAEETPVEGRTASEIENVIPDWWLNTTTEDTSVTVNECTDMEGESDAASLHFTPKKKLMGKRKKNKSTKENLIDTDDAELSTSELRKKKKQIFEDFSKSEHFLSTDADDQSSCAQGDDESQCEDESNDDALSVYSSVSRLSTVVSVIPESFPVGLTISQAVHTRKRPDDNFQGPKPLYIDPEYLTLYKLLSLLHIALLIRGSSITQMDLIRWVREGHIPLVGAHRLLPENMPLSGNDSHILGGTAQGRYKGVNSAKIWYDSKKMMHLLGVTDHLAQQPIHRIASRIVEDLQLPNEFLSYVINLDQQTRNSDLPVMKICNGTLYAGCLVLIVMKYLFGLDDSSEFEISDFAEKANGILKLKPSSGLGNKKEDFDPSCATNSNSMKTLFNWKEWTRFIKCRNWMLKRYHVPTAIRHGEVEKMDPEFVLHFAKTDGSLLLHSYNTSQDPKKEKMQEWAKVAEETAEKLANHFSSLNTGGECRRIANFKPTILPNQGIIEQLVEFDPVAFGGIKQHFMQSSLTFVLEPEPLATALRRTDKPHEVYVCRAPAIEETYLSTPFVLSTKARNLQSSKKNDNAKKATIDKKLSNLKRHEYHLVKLDQKEIVPVLDSVCDEDVAATQGLPKLVLYQPSAMYWVRAVRRDYDLNPEDWVVLQAELPGTFVWMLNQIADIIEEKPEYVYAKLTDLETIIFQGSGNLLHTLTNAKELKKRLSAAIFRPF